MNIQQASIYSGKSEKTLRRLIHKGKLPAALIEGKYHIEGSDLDALTVQPAPDTLSERIAALEDRIHTLEGLVSSLTTPTPMRRLTAPRTTYAHRTASQPEGTITLQALANELGINRRTLLDHVRNPENHLEHIAIPKPGRAGEHERYFTEEQVNAVKNWHAEHKH